MKKLIFIALAIILVFSMIMVSCKEAKTPTVTVTTTVTATASPTGTATPTETVAPPVDNRLPNLGALAKPEGGKEGGRLQLSAGVNINNIGDPTGTAGPSDAAYSFPCVEPLVVIDKNNNISPWLAEEILPADDGSSLTLKLRKGTNFTDGTPFNAEAAKYNIDTGINSVMWPHMKTVKECVIVNEYTIRLDFVDGKWDWTAVKSLAGFWSVMMFSPTFLKEHDAEYKMTHVIGTGPFIIKENIPDQNL